MSLEILGIGTATPPLRIAQPDAADWATSMTLNSTHRATVKKLYPRVGVRTRHSVLLTEDEDGVPAHKKLYQPAETAEGEGPSVGRRMQAYERSASPLALEAARRALAESQCDPARITHSITVSCSGFAAPGVDLELIRHLPLSPQVQRTHVGFMGCHGVLNGMRVAQAFAEADPNATILLCAVELCSLHHQYRGRADQIVANALFADGAAALVARASAARDGQAGGHWKLLASGSTIIPETEAFMTWQIRDHGFEMGLSPQVPAVIERTLRPWLAGWLRSYNISLADVNSWAIHPGGPKILQACANALELVEEQLHAAQEVLADYGNMSSPTVLFIVERLRRAGFRPPCVILAFGPGLTAEVALLVDDSDS